MRVDKKNRPVHPVGRLISAILIAVLFFAAFDTAFAQSEPLAQLIQQVIQHQAFRVNALVQSGFRYSFQDTSFQGGRTFEAANARLSFRGELDNGFTYRIFFNLAKEPNLLDAFIGYRCSEALLITAGAMKPRQTQDYIPDPGSTDFVDRTRITGLLVQSREIGISAEGDVDGFYYYAGFFNGNKLSANNNNRFYGIGRLQYAFGGDKPFAKIAVQGSHGDSPGVQSGNSGPLLRGERTIYGADVRIETGKILLAAEVLTGDLEIQDFADRKERISGGYVTAGYRVADRTQILGRWQTWGWREMGFRDSQMTLGVNHNFSQIASVQLNLDLYTPDTGDNQSAVSTILQIQF